MTETIIEAIIKLLAILTIKDRVELSNNADQSVRAYLYENFNKELSDEYLEYYNNHIQLYSSELIPFYKKGNIEDSPLISEICDGISSDNALFDRVLIFIQLLEFIKKEGSIVSSRVELIDYISSKLKIDPSEYSDIKGFVLFGIDNILNKDKLCIIDGNENADFGNIKHIYNKNQVITITVLRIASSNMLIFKYTGSRNLYLNGHKVQLNRTYVLASGSVLKTSRIRPIYYSRVLSEFTDLKGQPKIIFCAKKIEYKFKDNNYGVHPFSFCGESGQLVGIIGGSGTGKSTLLNVLNGNLKLNNGKISLNGYDLHEDNEKLKGLIGYVPQDDMLIEELTVFENLYYNARLCFDNLSEEKILESINHALVDFDLYDVKDFKVGSPVRKIISGGQRKRLNIALEMLREPSILFVDEPTSGLSSMDSEKVMHLLKRQTFKGKLVFIVIHQPSSDIYKLFDRVIIMDRGGYVIFNGNPVDAITYFKKHANFINAHEGECLSCGTIKTEQPLRIIEARKVNPYGRFERERRIKPEEWYNMYITKYDDSMETGMHKYSVKKRILPASNFKIPGYLKQFKLYTIRDMLSKYANKQYLIITLLEAPLLAIVLSIFTRYKAGTVDDPSAYIFSQNVNIPAYFFMSIIVALFLGLIQSAEEIYKERRLLKRESFLNLSRYSFLGSKIAILFMLSAIQMAVYTVIGNAILGIKDMNFYFWLILFSTACFANVLGLNLSSGLNSVIAIYILIPLLLIPQLLFSGAVVDFKKMPDFRKQNIYTPIIGDIMISRWAYEGLLVYQYTNNRYNKHVFPIEFERQQFIYINQYLIPELKNRVRNLNYLDETEKSRTLEIIAYETKSIITYFEKPDSIKHLDEITQILANYNNYSEDNLIDELLGKLDEINLVTKAIFTEKNKRKERILNELIDYYESESEFIAIKQNHYNKRLAENVELPFELHKIVEFKNRLYRNDKPIYTKTINKIGRAHFYAPFKLLGKQIILTQIFNFIIIWIQILLLVVLLYYDILRRGINLFTKASKQVRLKF